MQIFVKKLDQEHLLLRFAEGHFIGSWWKNLDLYSTSLTILHISNIYLLEVGIGYLILLWWKLYLFNMVKVDESYILLLLTFYADTRNTFLSNSTFFCYAFSSCLYLFLPFLLYLVFSSHFLRRYFCIILWRAPLFQHLHVSKLSSSALIFFTHTR